MKEAIIGGIFALLGSLVTFLGTYISTLNTKKEERIRRRIKSYLEELKGFYNLEQLYMKAVAQLRGKIPENQESANPLGIQKEFRRANEEECGIKATLVFSTASINQHEFQCVKA